MTSKYRNIYGLVKIITVVLVSLVSVVLLTPTETYSRFLPDELSLLPKPLSPSRPPLQLFLRSFVSVDFEPPAALHHFVRHYRLLGVPASNFLLVLHSDSENNPKLGPIADLLAAEGISSKHVWIGRYSVQNKADQESKIIGENVPKSENAWVLTADADELHVFRASAEGQRTVRLPDSNLETRLAADVFEEANQRGQVAVIGEFIDRITGNCTLKDAQEEPSLWSQYPRLSRVTAEVLLTTVTKVLAHSGPVNAGGGHHCVYPLDLPVWWDPNLFQVHHFKWTPAVIPKLQNRVLEYKKLGFAWWQESQRFLDHYSQTGQVGLCQDVFDPHSPQATPPPVNSELVCK